LYCQLDHTSSNESEYRQRVKFNVDEMVKVDLTVEFDLKL